jgi:hypothetical protein
MGRKAQPSITTGGIGVTSEVVSIAGMTVTGGVSVDLSPINIDISGNVDYSDPSKNNISVAAGAEIPGGLLGISGGVRINTSTGAIEEVAIGGEVIGIGVNVTASKDGGAGVEVSWQIPFTPISVNLGFGFPPPKKESISTPTPTPTPTPDSGEIASIKTCSTGFYQLGEYSMPIRTAIANYEDYANSNPEQNFQEGQIYSSRVGTANFYLGSDWYLHRVEGVRNIHKNYNPINRLGRWYFLRTASPELSRGPHPNNPHYNSIWYSHPYQHGAVSGYFIVDYMVAVKKGELPVEEP